MDVCFRLTAVLVRDNNRIGERIDCLEDLTWYDD